MTQSVPASAAHARSAQTPPLHSSGDMHPANGAPHASPGAACVTQAFTTPASVVTV